MCILRLAVAFSLALGMGSCLTVSAQSEDCLGCHLDSEGNPVHAMLQSAHGGISQSCEACHGASTEHMGQPTVASPDISFGPRWTASPALQDSQCLDCHQTSVARHWNEALHMAENVTCVSCHDLHVEQGPVRASGGQMQVCTTCHRTQKTGIHGRENMIRMNPPCTQCHNPHADQSPVGVMLANDSMGCRRCHNLEAMARSEKVSARAKSFHRVMDGGDRTCVGCHKGVAHGDTEALEPFIPLPLAERELTLFDPGSSDAEWLVSEHPGSQPLRQGTNCRQCHRGEEAELSAALGGPEPRVRALTVNFSSDDGALVTRLSWDGDRDDSRVSLMWGFGEDAALRRGGCWAACHDDMRGMRLDKGKPKYLWSALSQRRAINQPAVTKPEDVLAADLAAGRFAELWTIDLQSGALKVDALLDKPHRIATEAITAAVDYQDGRWTATVSRPLAPEAPLLEVETGRSYTFGAALHSKGHSGGDHWVSLPMTFSADRDDTDFIAH
jgi:predicted CXXCH cytochrome family protein